MTQSSILTLSQVSYTFPGASAPTIDHASVSFPKGWTGIIGNNGCGKTTLARLACGLLTPDSGQVSPRLSYAYCEQDAGIQPELLFDFSCDYNKEAQKARIQKLQTEYAQHSHKAAQTAKEEALKILTSTTAMDEQKLNSQYIRDKTVRQEHLRCLWMLV